MVGLPPSSNATALISTIPSGALNASSLPLTSFERYPHLSLSCKCSIGNEMALFCSLMTAMSVGVCISDLCSKISLGGARRPGRVGSFFS